MPDWLIQIGAYICVAGAIYGGIRQDIKNLHSGVSEAKAAASRAHERIDNFYERVNHGKA